MKNLLSILFCCTFLSFSLTAQLSQSDVNVGIGLVPTIISGTGAGVPISISLDKPLKSVDNLTIGGYLGYYGNKQTIGAGFSEWTVKYSVFIFGARSTYHFDFIENDKLDPYAGVMLGYNIVSAKVDGLTGDLFSGAAASGVGYAGLVGLRYQVSDSLRLYGELGYGIAVLSFGATFTL